MALSGFILLENRERGWAGGIDRNNGKHLLFAT